MFHICHERTGANVMGTSRWICHESVGTKFWNNSQVFVDLQLRPQPRPECGVPCVYRASYRDSSTDLSCKSQYAPIPHPTMHYFNRITKWCILEYSFDALWDLWDGSVGTTAVNALGFKKWLNEKWFCVKCQFHSESLQTHMHDI